MTNAATGPNFGDGPISRLARRLAPGHRGLFRVGILVALFAWVPLLVSTALAGTLVGGAGFEWSFGTHTRLLVAIPLFFLAESVFSERMGEVLRGMLRAPVVPQRQTDRFTSAWHRAHALWDSPAVLVALMLLTAVSIYLGFRTDAPAEVSKWRTGADGQSSLAGWWYVVVSLPSFQFLLWRWGWHLLVWGRLLWQISRLDLRLIPIHPDAAAGLGPLGVAHVDLAPLAFVGTSMFSATLAEQIMFGGARAPDYVVPLAATLVCVVAALIAPLFLFTPRLLDVKQKGLLEYGVLASQYTRAFEAKWLRRGPLPDEEILGTADLQSLADLGSSFGVIREMRIVPISMRQVMLLAISGAAPLVPLTFFEIPLRTLMSGLIGSLVGI